MTTPTKSVAFFGATGGSTISALHLSLKAGYACSALVRNPKKLADLLSSKYSMAVPANLRIVPGNAKDVNNVSNTLLDPATGFIADIVVFGIGGIPVFKPNPLKPTLDDPHVCEDTSNTVFTALAQLQEGGRTTAAGGKPVMGVVSTTGIPPGPRDIPVAWIPLYHWLLPVPHADKVKMEAGLEKAVKEGVLADFVILRPSLLNDGERSHGKVRAGYLERKNSGGNGTLSLDEGGCGWKGVKGLAVGYFISREDVGAFMFEEVVVKSGGENGEWRGKRVTLSN